MNIQDHRLAILLARLLYPMFRVFHGIHELGARDAGRRAFRSCGPNVRFSALDSSISFSQVDVGRDVFIGRWAYFSGEVIIGNDVMFGAMVHITDGYHRTDLLGSTIREAGPDEKVPVVIGDDVWVGARVTLMKGVTVHEGAIVGAGAVVREDVPPFTVAVGVPARPRSLRFDDDQLLHHLLARGRCPAEARGVVERRRVMLDARTARP